MPTNSPATDLDGRYSSPGATARSWQEAVTALQRAEIYWVSTVHPGGQPNVSPVIGIWLDGAFYFCTGAGERKALNLAYNHRVTVTTGCNVYGDGLDIVVEGEAVQDRDESVLSHLAEAYRSKYDWDFAVVDGGLKPSDAPPALVFRVAPVTAFGFGRGETFSQTRWRF